MSDPFAKRDLRRAIAQRLGDLSPVVRQGLDQRILPRLRARAEVRTANQILGYLPLDDEPDVVALFEEMIAAGKRVYIPIVDERSLLRYVRWTPRDGTRASMYGRWTPSSSEGPSTERSVILVPGRAFDRQGYRLGRGKGCYDRSLRSLASLGPSIGVAYGAQLLSVVPREPHDYPVDIVVTDREVVVRGSAGGASDEH